MNKAQLARSQQGVDGFFHAGAGDEVSEKRFQFRLFGGDYAVQIF